MVGLANDGLGDSDIAAVKSFDTGDANVVGDGSVSVEECVSTETQIKEAVGLYTAGVAHISDDRCDIIVDISRSNIFVWLQRRYGWLLQRAVCVVECAAFGDDVQLGAGDAECVCIEAGREGYK